MSRSVDPRHAPAPDPAADDGADWASQDRKCVADHRARLDWLLRVPEWTDLFARGLAELGLPGSRQGIGFNAALMSLPIESKFQLIRWTIEQFREHLRAEVGQRMCRLVGIETFNRLQLDEYLTARQWTRVRDESLFRLARFHRGYKHAQQRLFVRFRPIIDGVVAGVFRADLRADCAQEGALGLLAAIDRVNDGDASFQSYATQWVRRFVRNHLMRQRLPVYAPVNVVSRASRSSFAVEPEAADSPAEHVVREFLTHPAVSFDEPADESGMSLAETLVDGAIDPLEMLDRADLAGMVRRALESLTEKQRQVIVQRYGLEGRAVARLAEIARRFGISHQQVSMRERRALHRMQAALSGVASEWYAFD